MDVLCSINIPVGLTFYPRSSAVYVHTVHSSSITLENSSSVCFHTVYSSVCTYSTKFCCVLLTEQTMQLNCGLSRFTIKRKTFWRSALLLSAQGWRRIFQLQKWAGLWLTVLTHRFCLTQHRRLLLLLCDYLNYLAPLVKKY